jgi:hypothetical protein
VKKLHPERVEERQLVASVEKLAENIRRRAYELYELRDRE